jgi:hypothetical protein
MRFGFIASIRPENYIPSRPRRVSGKASQSVALQGLCEKWLLDCLTRHAVWIETGLRSRSPENGNISACSRRLSAFSPRKWPKSEPRDR